MALSASTTVNYPASRVAEVFADRDFVEHVSGQVGGTLDEFTVSGPVAQAFEATVVRSVPTDRLPEMVRKFVGQTLSITQHESWSAPAADGSRTVDITMDVAGAPVEVKAVQRLVADGESTTVELTGDVKSGIPFLGGKIAAAAEPFLGKALGLQARQAQAWLDRR